MNGTGRRGRIVFLTAAIAMAFPLLVMAEEVTKLDAIVITATRMEQKVSEQGSSVSIVTRENIELKSPAVAGDVLRTVPGVDVQRSGSAGNRENIKIRGGAGTQTLVMIDGFKVNSPTLGEFDISSLPVSDFERVEVIRGPQSALYGSNAMGGVVNFIPRKGEEGRQYALGLAGGSFSTLQWNGSARGAGKEVNAYLGASGLESDGTLRNDDTSLVSLLGSGEARVGSGNRLHAIVLYTHERKEVPIDFGSPRDENHDLKRRGFLAGGRWETTVSDMLSFMASGSTFRESFREKDPADPGEIFPFEFEDTTKTRKFTLEFRGRVTLGRLSTTFVGVEYQKDRGEDDLQSNFGPTNVSSSTINRSVYVQEELRLGKNAGVSLGARLDDNSTAGTEFNPKVAAFYEFARLGTKVRAAAGRGFRVPTVLETSDPTIGNPALSPEEVVSWEAGADVTFFEKKGKVSATWFHQDFKDLIQFDDSVPGPVGFGELRNVGKAYSRGVEAEAELYVIPGIGVVLSYTYSDTRDESRNRRILGVPRHRGTASLLLSPSPRWEGQVDVRVEGDQLDAPPNGEDIRRSGYARVDVFARYHWEIERSGVREIAVSGKVNNLLDKEYEERRGFPAPRFNFLLGAEVKI
jgi:vitamin B12 transporter